MLKYIFNALLGILFLILGTFSLQLKAQPDSNNYQVLEEVIAVIGGEILISSELKEQSIQYAEQFGAQSNNCKVYEQLLIQKLMLHNAKVDSVEVSSDMVEAEMDRRMRYFIQQIGSKKALEEFYGKSIVQLKKEFRELIKDQLLIQGLQQQIAGQVKITPAEVEEFYADFDKDSLPLVNSQVELAQLVVYPKINTTEKQKARTKLEAIRKEILEGKDFATQAVLYSDDPGSAAKGGDLGMAEKGTFVPEFDAVGLSLRDGELSKVFETQYGYHLMQMLERRGEKYQARHILIKPTVTDKDKEVAKALVDSLYGLLQKPEADFGVLVTQFSEDEDTKNSGGILINPSSGTPRFDMGEIDSQMFFVIDDMEKGSISAPSTFTSMGGKEGYRIVKLLERTAPHKANLNDDYQILKEAASSELKAEAMEKYIKRKLGATYVRLNPEFQSCNFIYNWLKAN